MKKFLSLAICAAAVGCKSSSPFDGNPNDIDVDLSGTEISFSQSNNVREFEIDAEQLYDGIVSGTDGEDRLYIREGDQSVVAFLLTGEGEVERYYARLANLQEIPVDPMTATGRYVGFSPTEFQDTPIVGDVILTVNFDDGTLSGEVVNRTLIINELDGFFSAGPPVLRSSTDIMLTEGQFGLSGQFTGAATLVEDGVTVEEGTFEGLQSGTNGRTFVGEIVLENESGVFLAD